VNVHERQAARVAPTHVGTAKSWPIDAKEVIELIKWIDYKMPLFYSTGKLEKSAKEMKAALMEILEAVK
jgi:hypothetical protein